MQILFRVFFSIDFKVIIFFLYVITTRDMYLLHSILNIHSVTLLGYKIFVCCFKLLKIRCYAIFFSINISKKNEKTNKTLNWKQILRRTFRCKMIYRNYLLLIFLYHFRLPIRFFFCNQQSLEFMILFFFSVFFHLFLSKI